MKQNMMDQERAYWVLLSQIPGIGAVTFQRLLECFGTVEKIFLAKASELKAIGLSETSISHLKKPNWRSVKTLLKWAEQPSHFILTLPDPHYPTRLKTIADAPPVLYVQGDVTSLQTPQIAIVGSRNPSWQGIENAVFFSSGLAKAGIVITSGLALGIDIESHQGALKANGVTIAVLGTGVDVIYPRKHQQVANAIIERGALVSEFPLGTPPKTTNFPRRNRIISGLSLGVLIIEAALKSGSLITARFALEQNREVFAVPGSIHNPLAKGCHWLLRQGAKLVQNIEDILEEIAMQLPELIKKPDPALPNDAWTINALASEYQELLKCLTFEPASMDIIIKRSQLSVSKVTTMLVELELQGVVACTECGYFIKRTVTNAVKK